MQGKTLTKWMFRSENPWWKIFQLARFHHHEKDPYPKKSVDMFSMCPSLPGGALEFADYNHN